MYFMSPNDFVDYGEDEVKKGGRTLKEETQYNFNGKEIRIGLRDRVKSIGRKRPKVNWYREYNIYLNYFS